MGIKDQFQEKAGELRDRAQNGAKGAKGAKTAKDEQAERTARLQERAKPKTQEQTDRAREQAGENWDV
ncbi:hypothetical protein [Streptomyces sp. NPDC054849]